MATLNLGILAHVDAGKTTLTERLLYATGAIDAVGSVDGGTTQTDTLELERRRGITIRAAVATFVVDDLTVNIIDTPGHPDFIAEVDRSLSVLDGAILVVSAVEGVQAQTVVLMRALRRLRVPTIIYINKVDRPGADPDEVVGVIRGRLSPNVVVLGAAENLGTPAAVFRPHRDAEPAVVEALADSVADYDENLLEAIVDQDHTVSMSQVRSRLAAQVSAAHVYPVLFGSAITGAGVDELIWALGLLPTAPDRHEGPPSASVFKVERGPEGEKVAYVRVFGGSIRVRDRIVLGPGNDATVTALKVFEPGAAVNRSEVSAGRIAKLWGLRDVQVGAAIGEGADARSSGINDPTLETAVVPSDPSQKAALHVALTQLAEQDPLINLRQDDRRQELSLSLYGEVQKEIIQQTLAADFGIDVEFRETTTICIERPIGTGRAVEWLGRRPNPFLATIGLKIEPAPPDSGIEFRLDLDVTSIPLYVYKSVSLFHDAIDGYVRATFEQGLKGWKVDDCVVTMTDSGYSSPGTSAADYRKLTPLVAMKALQRAGTRVCEPIDYFHLEAPIGSLAAVHAVLAQLKAKPGGPQVSGAWAALEGQIPAANVGHLRQQLHGLTHGEGVLEVEFSHFANVVGPAPTRPRSDDNPLNRKEYLLHVLRRV